MEKITNWSAKRSGASMTLSGLKDGKPVTVTGVDWIGVRDGKIVTDADGEPDYELVIDENEGA